MGCVWKAKQTLWQNKRQSSSNTNRVKADGTWDVCTLLQLSSFSDWRDEGRGMVEGWGGYRRVWESSRSVHSPLCCWQCRPCQPPACLPPRGEAFCRCLPRSWHGPRPTCPQSPGWLCHFCRWLCLRNGKSGESRKGERTFQWGIWCGDEAECQQQNELSGMLHCSLTYKVPGYLKVVFLELEILSGLFHCLWGL